jgi:hypothetical protein
VATNNEPDPADQKTWKQKLESAKQDIGNVGGIEGFRSGEWLQNLTRQSLRSYFERADVAYFRRKYPGQDNDFIARKMIKVAAKNAALVGAATGVAMSADEIATVAGGGPALPANIAIAFTALAANVLVTTRIQMRLIAELTKLEDVPLDPNDPEDILHILEFAVLAAMAEVAGKKLAKIAGKAAATQATRKALLKALQAMGSQIGVKILKRNVAKLAVPFVSIPLGGYWNYRSTKTIAKRALVRVREIKAERQRAVAPGGSPAPLSA